MLIVSRKTQEAIHIGDNIVIRITAINGQRVRVGIEAPSTTRVLRGELITRSLSTATPLESATARSTGVPHLPARRLGDVPVATTERHPLRWSMAAMRERLSRTIERNEPAESTRHGRSRTESQEAQRSASHRGHSGLRG